MIRPNWGSYSHLSFCDCGKPSVNHQSWYDSSCTHQPYSSLCRFMSHVPLMNHSVRKTWSLVDMYGLPIWLKDTMVIFVSECVFWIKDTMINLTFCQNGYTTLNWKIPNRIIFQIAMVSLRIQKPLEFEKDCREIKCYKTRRRIKNYKNVAKWTCESVMMGIVSLKVDIKMSFYAKLNMKRQWHHIRKWFGSLKKWSLTLNKDSLSMKIKDYLRIPRSFRISLIDVFSNNSKINRILIESQNDTYFHQI